MCNEMDEIILRQAEAKTLFITCTLFYWEIVGYEILKTLCYEKNKSLRHNIAYRPSNVAN